MVLLYEFITKHGQLNVKIATVIFASKENSFAAKDGDGDGDGGGDEDDNADDNDSDSIS